MPCITIPAQGTGTQPTAKSSDTTGLLILGAITLGVIMYVSSEKR